MNGKKTFGKFEWKDGNYYQGDIQNNLFNGYGIYKWVNKRQYEGRWKNGKMKGKGKLTYSDGSYYEGYFINNMRNGHGIYYWNDNRYFDVQWKNGKQNGQGIYYNNGVVTKGLWVDGKLFTKKNYLTNTDYSSSNSLFKKSFTNKLTLTHNINCLTTSEENTLREKQSHRFETFEQNLGEPDEINNIDENI